MLREREHHPGNLRLQVPSTTGHAAPSSLRIGKIVRILVSELGQGLLHLVQLGRAVALPLEKKLPRCLVGSLLGALT